MIIFPCNLGYLHWNSGHLTSGGNTNLGNLPFTLYLMEAATGFSDNAQGIKHYIDICKHNDFLPVGCGTSSYNCDRNRYNGEPCLPMPETWGCNMMSDMKTNTGWGNNIVAFLADASSGNKLFKPYSGDPNENENLQAVCGKIAGIF